MRKITLSIFTLGLIFGLNGCNSSPEDNLKNSLDEYIECTIDSDFKCMAEFTNPSLIKTMGGINAFEQAMKSSGVTISKIDVKNISPIKKDGNVFFSKITCNETAKINGQEMKINAVFNATSKDGKNWFFTNQQ